MNDELLSKILDACGEPSDMVCSLSNLKCKDTKEWAAECQFDEDRNPLGCTKCMAEVADWLRSKGVI